MKIDKAIPSLFSSADIALETLKSALNDALEQAQAAFDVKSEKWQESDKGQDAQSQLDTLQSIVDQVESAYEDLDAALSDFRELTGEA